MCNISSKCWNKLFSHFRECKFEGFFSAAAKYMCIWMDEWVCCSVFYPCLNICTIYTMLHSFPDWGICDPSIQPAIVCSFVTPKNGVTLLISTIFSIHDWQMSGGAGWVGWLLRLVGGWLNHTLYVCGPDLDYVLVYAPLHYNCMRWKLKMNTGEIRQKLSGFSPRKICTHFWECNFVYIFNFHTLSQQKLSFIFRFLQNVLILFRFNLLNYGAHTMGAINSLWQEHK